MIVCIIIFSSFYLFVFNKLKKEIKRNGDIRTINFNRILETLEGSSNCIKIILNDNAEEVVNIYGNQSYNWYKSTSNINTYSHLKIRT